MQLVCRKHKVGWACGQKVLYTGPQTVVTASMAGKKRSKQSRVVEIQGAEEAAGTSESERVKFQADSKQPDKYLALWLEVAYTLATNFPLSSLSHIFL